MPAAGAWRHRLIRSGCPKFAHASAL